MAHPIRYFVRHSFEQDERNGEPLSGTLIEAEFAQVQESLGQVNDRLRLITTPEGTINPLEILKETDIRDEETFTGDGMTVLFNFPDMVIDLALDFTRVTVDDVIIPAADYTLTATSIDFTPSSAPANGADIVVRNYPQLSDALTSVTDLAAAGGAGQIGYADALGIYAATDVEAALDEVMTAHNALQAEFNARGDYILADGSRALDDNWEVNARSGVFVPASKATGSFDMVQPPDGATVQLDDGVYTETFEFDNNAAVAGSNTAVTIGADYLATANALASAVNGSPLAIEASVVDNGADATVTFTHHVPAAYGNNAIIVAGDAGTITNVTGLSGGADVSLLTALAGYRRIRNHPRSLQDGDVVVHEQLADINTQVSTLAATFVRTDGKSVMNGNLNLGGNNLVLVADGVNAGDGVNKSQLDAVQAIFNQFTPLAGRANSGGYGFTYTGAHTYGNDGTGTADVDPLSGSHTPTLYGVPLPSANDHAVNKNYTDTADQVLQVQINDILAGDAELLDPAGCELDGSGLGAPVADINSGGEYNFESLTVTAAQAPATDTILFINGDVTINNTITMAAGCKLEIRCTGNITINNAITAGDDVILRADGNITIAGAITATLYDVDVYAKGSLTVSQPINAEGIFLRSVLDSTISSTITALLSQSGGTNSGSGTGAGADADGRYGGLGAPSHGLSNIGGGGGGGGTAGGDGGDGDPVGSGNIGLGGGGVVSSPSSYRPYLFPVNGGGGGGAGGNASPDDGGDAGGTIWVYCAADLDLTGSSFVADGGNGQAAGPNSGGGGGGGAIRVVAKGVIDDGTLSADGGNGGGTGNQGGGGGGGIAVLISSGLSGVQNVSAAAGAGGGGSAQPGVAGVAQVATLPADDIQCLFDQGRLTQ